MEFAYNIVNIYLRFLYVHPMFVVFSEQTRTHEKTDHSLTGILADDFGGAESVSDYRAVYHLRFGEAGGNNQLQG